MSTLERFAALAAGEGHPQEGESADAFSGLPDVVERTFTPHPYDCCLCAKRLDPHTADRTRRAYGQPYCDHHKPGRWDEPATVRCDTCGAAADFNECVVTADHEVTCSACAALGQEYDWLEEAFWNGMAREGSHG